MMVLGSVTQPGAPDIASVLSYYANAAVWAWHNAWSFGADKLRWGISVSLVAAVIVAVIVRRLNGNWRPSLIGGMVAAVAGPTLVLLGMVAFNLMRYPVIHEAELQRPHRLGLGAAYGIFDALHKANLKAPGNWSVIFTGPVMSDSIQQDIRSVLLMAVPEVLFPELPKNSNNLDALRLPEPPKQPGVTIRGSSALAHALGELLGSCFVIRTTGKMVDGLERLFDIEHLVWIEIGVGSPWSTDRVCSE